MKKVIPIALLMSLFIQCGNLKTIVANSSECSTIIDDSIIREYTDPDNGYVFSTIKGFHIQRLKDKNNYLYIATSPDSMFQHYVKIISHDQSDHLPNYQSNVLIKRGESRKLYSSKLKQDYKFNNGAAFKKLDDTTQIKGLVAMDFYEFKDQKKSVIVTAIDFCNSQKSNNIESYFILNREPVLK